MRPVRKLILALLWLFFMVLWCRAYWITTIGDVKDAVVYLAAIIAAYGALVTIWILHTLALYRKTGPRTAVVTMNFAAIHDGLGSYIVAPKSIRHKKAITVRVNAGRKVFSETVTQESCGNRTLSGTF